VALVQAASFRPFYSIAQSSCADCLVAISDAAGMTGYSQILSATISTAPFCVLAIPGVQEGSTTGGYPQAFSWYVFTRRLSVLCEFDILQQGSS
jgi:hypothetical protein